MSVVLDASAVAPLLIPDEQGGLVAALPDVLAESGAVVPCHWRLEVVNLLLNAWRRERLTEADRSDAVATLDNILVETDNAPERVLVQSTWPLAERHRLSIYDAAYLELALRRDLPLASADRRLLAAAQAEGVELFGG